MHVTLTSNSPIDLSGLTWVFVSLSLTGTAMWFFMQVAYLFVKNRSIQEHAAMIRDKRYTQLPLVSIIIPARNEEAVIKRTIASCLAQTFGNLEVIVVCHNCSDGTFQQAQSQDPRVFPYDFRTDEAGKGLALNFGVSKAKGEYILVLDSDGIMNPDFTTNALPYFDKGFAAVQGKIVASNREYNRNTKLLALEGDLYSTPFMTVRSLFEKRAPLGGTGLVISRDALMRAGGFKNALIDDFELSFRFFRFGERIAFAPLCIVYDEKPPKLDLIIRQRSRWVKGHFDLLKEKVPESRDLFGNIYWLNPIFMLAGLASLAVMSTAILSYIFLGQMPFKFSFLPIVAWIVLTLSSMALQIFLLTKELGIRGLRYAGYVALLAVYSNYWYVSLVKSFFVKSWATTKTSHGFVSEKDLQSIIVDKTGSEKEVA